MVACSELPGDIWLEIGDKLDLAADRIRFRCVCKLWRSILPFPHPPWLMLAENHEKPDSRGVFGMGNEQLHQFHVPELHEKRIVVSQGTWLVIIDFNGIIQLFNPFTRLVLDLPPQSAFEYGYHTLPRRPGEEDYQPTPKAIRDGNLHKVLLSGSPNLSPNVTAMAIYYCRHKLAIARPGDATWTSVQTPNDFFHDIIFFNNHFYAIDQFSSLFKCDLQSNPPTAASIAPPVRKAYRFPITQTVFYLVEWKAQLLFVIKRMYDTFQSTYEVETFHLFILNTVSKWRKLEDLEEYSLFLGFNTSKAVLAAEYPRLRKNCIYFTDDYLDGYKGKKIHPGSHAMGVFDLENGSVKPLPFRGKSTSYITPPIWIVPETI